MTDIVPAPDVALSSQFPTNADRVAGVFNARSAAWADSSRAMAADMDDAAKSAETNAIAAHERALAAEQARDVVLPLAQQVGEDAGKVAADRAAVEQYVLEGPVININGFTGAVPVKTINGLSIVGEPGNIDGGVVKYSSRTAAAELNRSDIGYLIDISGGSFTQTFASCSSLGDGWFIYLKNSGAGDITLDPNGAELIDGLTSYIMYPGEVRLVQCDGVALRTIVLNSFYKVFTVSGNFIKPPGYREVEVLMWPGGASGNAVLIGNTSGHIDGYSGQACQHRKISTSDLESSTQVTIGSGGYPASRASVAGAGTVAGNSGGNTSFGPFTVTATKQSTATASGLPVSSNFYDGGASANAGGSSGGGSVFGNGGDGGASITFNGVQFQFGYRGVGGTAYGVLGSLPRVVWTNNGNNDTPAGVYTGADGNSPGGNGQSVLVHRPNSGVTATSGAGARGELRIWGII